MTRSIRIDTEAEDEIIQSVGTGDAGPAVQKQFKERAEELLREGVIGLGEMAAEHMVGAGHGCRNIDLGAARRGGEQGDLVGSPRQRRDGRGCRPPGGPATIAMLSRRAHRASESPSSPSSCISW